MKAIVCRRYGLPGVLAVRNTPKPIPKDHEVLIRIKAVPVTTPDRRIRGLMVPFPKAQAVLKFFLRARFGFTKPRNPILGNYLAGTVETVGKGTAGFHAGDEVYAYTGDRRGTYAEYICLSEKSVIADKPASLTFEETAAIPYGGCNALYFLKKAGGVKAGQKVLIYGASGAIGTSAVQLAKHYGAEVTGVCSGANTALVKSLGADFTVDYTKEDFTKGKKHYDLIFDAVGKVPASDCRACLHENGRYISVFSGNSQICKEDLSFLKTLVESGKFQPVVDQCYPMEKIAGAHGYADLGHTKGIVVISMGKGV